MTIDLSNLEACTTAQELVSELLALPAGLSFRGQGVESYGLISSLKRRLGSVAPEERRVSEIRIVSSFVNALGDRIQDASLVQVLAQMQHHGAPTRMIDISRSPFVAAYFCAVEHWDVDGRIFVCDPSALLRDWLAESLRVGKKASDYQILDEPGSFRDLQEQNLRLVVGESVGLPLPVAPPAASERMRAQSGLFLAEPLSRDWIVGAEKSGHLGSFVVPADLKPKLLEIAIRSNNGGGTLFPGTDGVGREIIERELTNLNGLF
jgi:FRG domain